MAIGTLHNINSIDPTSERADDVHVDRYSTFMWLDTQFDDMASADDHAILSRTPQDFNGGENCMAVGTLHNIEFDVQVDRYSVHVVR